MGVPLLWSEPEGQEQEQTVKTERAGHRGAERDDKESTPDTRKEDETYREQEGLINRDL